MSNHSKSIFVGNSEQPISSKGIAGSFTKIDGEEYYRISNFDSMPPFFMTVVSFSDHWLFISSNGSLSAGRKNPNTSIFPYYTVDKIHDGNENTGSKTIVHVSKEGKNFLWEPFSDRYSGVYDVSRNVYKNTLGNKVIFEEINSNFGLTFRYSWKSTEEYGFIRTSEILNESGAAIDLDVLDGVQNVLPFGVDRLLQQTYSNLADGYKKNELLEDAGIGLFMLSSIIVDKAEPSEALKTNVVWSLGTNDAKYLISSRQLNKFRRGEGIETELDIRATRGAYFVNQKISLQSGSSESWIIATDISKDAGQVASLRSKLKNGGITSELISQDIDYSSDQLELLLNKSDAVQLTSDELSIKRHLSNVLFNIMRGGICEDDYLVRKSDFYNFAKHANSQLVSENKAFFDALESELDYQSLLASSAATNNAGLIRLCHEYLPISFSRRHGDPSRPWNQFSIDVKNEDGSKSFNYEGNWRDIFQNWEALSLSFPEYIEGMISKFVNASTADGYNPYRIMRDGIDWELLEPDDPWSNIGYWGDHQIIYLLKLLEISFNHHPEKLEEFLSAEQFAYANVPYIIKPYEEIIKNPRDTIDFNDDLEELIKTRVDSTGSDGKLIWTKDDKVLMVNFTEKLLVTLLAKLSNFVPEAGIWLNTQRPEWNDANNALVGNGVSMVTLYQIRRFVVFLSNIYGSSNSESFNISKEVADLFASIHKSFNNNANLLSGAISDTDRKAMVDELGEAGTTYRHILYNDGFSEEKNDISKESLLAFFDITLKYLDHSIKANKRDDNMYHSYNLISFSGNEVKIKYLYEMLEGQVNVLASGFLSPIEVVELLDGLKSSALYRQDQNSYILYPDRQLPRFDVKNNIPEELVNQSKLMKDMIASGDDQLVYQDEVGDYHFNGNFRNAEDLLPLLDNVASEERDQVLSIFEAVFDHESFTGRSGSFFAFEGLGSIYWHMVSKLLLSVNECYFAALEQTDDEVILGRLVSHYYEIRAGIGLNKTPEEFGAFPTDAYSHTPGNAGAQQPGMTGQVKEDILARYGELGVFVSEGQIYFDARLLRKEEFLNGTGSMRYFDLNDEIKTIEVGENSMAFTYCQTPFVYTISDEDEIIVNKNSGETEVIKGNKISKPLSKSLFERSNVIKSVEVKITPKLS